ncbi:arf-GAP with dual PH domain-containing protein 1-like isoform X2 [Amphibalanus amphitrite]|uniref:arf-GAP with dual PH domain-containing protein 1-like isoform X2 n=1 Tax=Amphibalanus amphitrite TaxID=1232801 RepID=UPI001C91CCEC|nr:arf-GAP with dual PH domain-containing protein 1-like isoform X2 [Amphibalanus amphitrite]XP_043201910.1 arf-GAP with dual PH domain-containing protein 1-like isoform X2 [Amphibalanus amphitrite]
MSDQNARILEISRLPGNDVCADCRSPQVEYASYNLGVFLCTTCVGIHRSMGTHISQTRHLRVDRWLDENQIIFMEQHGNEVSNAHYERYLPDCYRRPDGCAPAVLLEQFIRAKYEREEFLEPARQVGYMASTKSGHLMKRGRDAAKFEIRRFELSEATNTLSYYVKEGKHPKQTMSLQAMNVALVPEKVNHPNGMQITYVTHGTIRHIFVYHNDGQTTIDWYMAIRNAKLNYLRVAFPGHSAAELTADLTHDFHLEGWLHKIGPRAGDQYRRRWFTLDDRQLMYHDQPLDPVPKGVISIGEPPEWAVKEGVPPGSKDQGFSFTLKTPERTYLLSAQTAQERTNWMQAITEVLRTPPTPQQRALAGSLHRKQSSGRRILR